MTQEKANGRIRITKVPAGGAPFWVREAWVGLVLPCYPVAGRSPGGARDLRAALLATDQFGYHCPQDLALKALEKRSPATVAWWKDSGFPHSGKNFCFKIDEAEVVSGVTVPKLRVADDMATGVFELPGR